MGSPSESFAALPRRGMLARLAEMSSPAPSPKVTTAQLLELFRCLEAKRPISPEAFAGLTKKAMRERLANVGVKAKGSRARLSDAYVKWYAERGPKPEPKVDSEAAAEAAPEAHSAPEAEAGPEEAAAREAVAPEAEAEPEEAAAREAVVPEAEAEPEEAATPETAAPEAPPAPEAAAPVSEVEPDAEAGVEPAAAAGESEGPTSDAEAASEVEEAAAEAETSTSEAAEEDAADAPARVSIVPTVLVSGRARSGAEDDDVQLSTDSLPPEERAELEALFALDDEPEISFETLPPEAQRQVLQAVEDSSQADFEIPSVRLKAPAVPDVSANAPQAPPSAATSSEAAASAPEGDESEAPRKKKRKKKKKKKRKSEDASEVASESKAESAGASAQPAAPAGKERRGAKRVELEVDIGYLSDTNFYQGFSEDLSEGGLFVATVALLPMGQAVELSFVLPGGAAVKADGRVAWVRQGRDYDSQTRAGMGVAFEKVSGDGEKAIRAYMSVREPMFYID